MQIALRDRILDLRKGELVVIPKGVEHKPLCTEQCTVLLDGAKGNTEHGQCRGALTDAEVSWI